MYILEGNIGAGKSTFLRLLSEHMPAIGISLEPVHNWQKEVYGQSLLANFYQEPRRWAYTFETMTMICRIQDTWQNSGTPSAYALLNAPSIRGTTVLRAIAMNVDS